MVHDRGRAVQWKTKLDGIHARVLCKPTLWWHAIQRPMQPAPCHAVPCHAAVLLLGQVLGLLLLLLPSWPSPCQSGAHGPRCILSHNGVLPLHAQGVRGLFKGWGAQWARQGMPGHAHVPLLQPA